MAAQIAFVATFEGRNRLWVRPLNSATARPLPGTEDARIPFWSPDGRSLGFFATGRLLRIDPAGGPPQLICAASVDTAPSWGPDDTILFAQTPDAAQQRSGGVYRVSARGGAVTQVTVVDRAKGESEHYWPSFLPDGVHFFYVATVAEEGHDRRHVVFVGSTADATVTRVAEVESRMTYSPTGHVLYGQDGALLARPFDLRTYQLTGDPVSIAERSGTTGPRASPSTRFRIPACWPTTAVPASRSWCGWIAPDDGSAPWAPAARTTTFASRRTDARLPLSSSIHVRDRPTFPSSIGNQASRRGSPRIPAAPAGRCGRPAAMCCSIGWRVRTVRPTSIRSALTGGARTKCVWRSTASSSRWMLRPTAATSSTTTPIARRSAISGCCRCCLRARPGPTLPRPPWNRMPASRRTAGGSRSCHRNRVRRRCTVAPIDDSSARRRVSTDGGLAPRWGPGGRELVYLDLNDTLMAMTFASGPAMKTGLPRPLFSAGRLFRNPGGGFGEPYYDLAPDGQSFLVNRLVHDAAVEPINVVLNWPSLLDQRQIRAEERSIGGAELSRLLPLISPALEHPSGCSAPSSSLHGTRTRRSARRSSPSAWPRSTAVCRHWAH